ncbi:hypothetical protein L202_08420 [Cryptococcus amylolentus CBS 6039]|uniref:Eisosome component PIL1-domain-containing protein n=2 Tax=Cryptococcus amylolentus TaxID=104669 RepID=A0A1E3HA50_9TREE|nr:hypothetical protein L202_08420 [Cryptococcus amylolentus CBS 6039]ODN73025.1 hypothetical protein L202_08420 [Cryptococcus amylolentus CBS 6039]ODN98177.1 hypothetical protein I350_07823 [Cryptococcus amylolentus CBS 6273]
MSLRGPSGKFSLAGFGRKVSGVDRPSSPVEHNSSGYEDETSPVRESHGGAGFDGFGQKLQGKLAHNRLLPSLGHKDLRLLQDIISSEKGVLAGTEKLSSETAKASSALPPYGQQEGPDLQDILTQSSTLLNHLTTALTTFSGHTAKMRASLKKVREREEGLIELKSRRKTTGTKAEGAERKLSKMGPENKALPQQTELLERLRQEIRQLDQDILTEETKMGDFKRQAIKEALSYKFGGLEELGEKMCIIGELGKLLLEEVPLEETPTGYGRAPYTGYDKTESAVNEATKCLATVEFHAASHKPKPPGLPQPGFAAPLRTPTLPHTDSNHDEHERGIAAAADYGDYPANTPHSPPRDYLGDIPGVGQGREREATYALDNADPYGGIESNPYEHAGSANPYDEFGGTRQVVFDSPHHDQPTHFVAPIPPAVSSPAVDREAETSGQGEVEHGYEYEQQKAMEADDAWRKLEAEEAAWRTQAEAEDSAAALGAVPPPVPSDSRPAPQISAGAPWEPLKLSRQETPDHASRSLHDGPSHTNQQPAPSQVYEPAPALPNPHDNVSPASGELAPPPSAWNTRSGGTPTPSQGHSDAFHTPMASPQPEAVTQIPPVPDYIPESEELAIPPPAQSVTPQGQTPTGQTPPSVVTSPREYFPGQVIPSASGGKISKAAFRRGKPKTSLGPNDDITSPSSVTSAGIAGHGAGGPSSAGAGAGYGEEEYQGVRRLPVPPIGTEAEALAREGVVSPPPVYQTEESLR